jgi:GT2 family glycosyltransferase
MISIIIPVWNQLDYTIQCAETIKAYSTLPHEVIWIDNGSVDGTGKYLWELCGANPNYKLISNPTNFGYPIACNQGIALSKGEYIVILNNDTVVSPEWLEGMKECMESDPTIGIVGPRTNNISGPQQFTEGRYTNIHEFISFAAHFRKSLRKQYHAWWRIVGFCMMIRRKVIEDIGTFDERFTPGNYEDDDFCTRSILAGWRNVMCGDVFIHHQGSASHVSLDHQKLLEENKAKFDAKWAEWRKDNSSISCATIVKNEEKIIHRFLDHVLPLVDEVVIVDTGSTDKTVEMIEARKDQRIKIHHFEWCDDFSKARDFANSKCTKRWILSLDADEVLPKLDRSNLCPQYAYAYETRNYTERVNYSGWTANQGEYPEFEEGTGWFPSLKVRLFLNDKRLHWTYPVHEVLEPSVYHLGYSRVKVDVPVHHKGKLDVYWDNKKGESYYEYLKGVVADFPEDYRHIEELAVQSQNIGKFDEAIDLWKRLSAMRETFATYLNLGHCYACKGELEDALLYSEKACEMEPDNRESATNKALILFRMQKYEDAKAVASVQYEKHPEYPPAVAVFNASTEMIAKMAAGPTRMAQDQL